VGIFYGGMNLRDWLAAVRQLQGWFLSR